MLALEEPKLDFELAGKFDEQALLQGDVGKG